MKKIFVLMLTALLLTACGSNESEKEEPVALEKDSQVSTPSQEELDAKLKEEAKEYSFVELNSDEVAKDEKVKLTGEVSAVSGSGVNSTFTLTTKENDGVGMFSVKNFSLEDIADGNTVTIYGTYNGKNDVSMPEIVATIIEK
ncbi:hypothetical protein [Sporosarcina sp. Te-1]|uniref:OB-fold protein n=1 Tax=Sporosarcina sp. Te-1 TaxID=2818390 RepID=UPI001A9FDF0D|nr:hypothetical protein [Sporosarcina sp. Te-1]QTD40436.1 hypothetical protein J3U78_16910 [Sporosarcina sp. Te-1]